MGTINITIMKKIIFILCVITFIVSAENEQLNLKKEDKHNTPELELTIEETQIYEEKESLGTAPDLELSVEKDKFEIETELKEETIDLELTAKEEHVKKPDKDEVPLWKVMGSGMIRGFANIALSPGEIVRGITYEYTAKKWYYAVFTSGVAALGGTMARMGAGLADVITLGYFGDIQLAKGFPDYVWEGDWVYHGTNITNNVEQNSK